jgi:hypothetical protein
MSDTVIIILVIVIGIVVVLFMFRDRLKRFSIKGSKDEVEANLETYKENQQPASADAVGKPSQSYGVNISGNKQVGKGNKIDVAQKKVNVSYNVQLGQGNKIDVPQNSVNVNDNIQLGKEQEIVVGPTPGALDPSPESEPPQQSTK